MSRPIVVDGKTLFRVDVTQTRSAVFWVLAASEKEAREDSEELIADVRDGGWDEIEDDCWAQTARSEPPDDALVWTGGENGNDVQWATLKQSPPPPSEA